MGNESSSNHSTKHTDSSVDDIIPTPILRNRKSPSVPQSAYMSTSLMLPCIDDSTHMPPTSPSAISNRSLSSLSKSKSNLRLKSHHRRKSSLLAVHNGITGKFISSRICKIAAKFWLSEIENLSVADQLEIGCSIFFSMLAANSDMKKVMKRQFSDNKTNKIESTSLKYLDMMGWLIRYLVTDNVDLYQLLIKLGGLHQKMGIHIEHFPPMRDAMHETFAYYFETKYSMEIQYAIDEIFSLAAQLMTGEPFQCSAMLMDINVEFQSDDIPFLTSLDTCLKSSIGKQYLYRYLAQTWCDEIAIFLKSLTRFKNMVSDKERFMVAREILKTSIQPYATFALNLSYDTRQCAMSEMEHLESMFAAKESFVCGLDFYSEIEKDINKLIMDNHWNKFVEGIEILHSKSAYVE